MHSFHPKFFSAAVIASALAMSLLGAFVLIPIAFIQWGWNALIVQLFALPLINGWQASLLYLAAACMLYLFGLIQIEIKYEAPK